MAKTNIPCADAELEKSIIGVVIIESHAYLQVSSRISEKSFNDPRHRTIWKVISEMKSSGVSVDLITLVQDLRVRKKLESSGGASYVSDVATSASGAGNLQYHAMILRQYEIKREGILMARDIAEKSMDNSVNAFDYLSHWNTSIQSLQKLVDIATVKPDDEIYNQIEQAMEIARTSGGVTGIPSGIKAIDKNFFGWQNSDLIVIGGRPGMGKTALALTLADNACWIHGKKCMFFSLEMSAKQLVARRISKHCGIPAGRITTDDIGHSGREKVRETIKMLSGNTNLLIDDGAGLSIDELCMRAYRAKTEDEIDFMIVDYLQLISDKSIKGTRADEMSSVARKLKNLAKSLNIPVIALAQLSRSVESRGGDRTPMMSDLKESGGIEEAADIVLFTYRPCVYKLSDEYGLPYPNDLAFLYVGKYRNFSSHEIPLKFNGLCTYFDDWTEVSKETVDADQWHTPSYNDDNPF